MKKMIALSLLLVAVSCASKPEAERDVASVEACQIVMRASNPGHYRVEVHGNPYNKYWYSKKNAEKIHTDLMTQGRCH